VPFYKMLQTKNKVILDGCEYYFIITKDETKLEFVLHNDELLFIEIMTTEEFQKKIVEYNMDIEDIDSESFLKEISKTFCGSIDSKIETENKTDEELILKFNFETEGIPLAYKFKLRKGTSQEFCRYVTSKILNVIELLMQDRKELMKIIHNKDLELAEYKKSGLKLSRKDLATNEFVPDKYEINYIPNHNTPQEILMSSDVEKYIKVVETAKVQTKQDANENTIQTKQTNGVKSKKALKNEHRMAIQASLIAPSTVVNPSHQNKKALKRELSPGAKRKAALAKKLQSL